MRLEEIMRRRDAGESDESIVELIRKQQQKYVYTPEQMERIEKARFGAQIRLRQNQRKF